MNRAYSQLVIKSVDDDERIIRGIASTPTPDRMEDVIVPSGAKFSLPLPLLYQHDHKRPIGNVTAANVTSEGISITAQMAKGVAPYIDEAWSLIKAGLVRGLSIGFRPLEDPEPIKGSFGYKFNAWEWFELSAVTIPANAEASILTIKSADQALLAASGDRQRPVVRLSPPGASGKPQSIPKGNDMKTIQEQISALEAKRAASVARREDIQGKAIGEGRTKDETEKQQFDELTTEIKSIDDELGDLRVMETQMVKSVVTTAAPQRQAVSTSSGIISVGNRLQPGQKFARVAMALYQSQGNLGDAAAIVRRRKDWMDTSPEVEIFFKTAVATGDTTTSGWASELVYAQNLANEFIEYLRPMTILGKLTGTRNVPFNVRMASATAGTSANWVGQAKPIPVSKMTTSSTSLGITKIAGLVTADDELLRSSSPSAELLVRDDLAEAISVYADDSFINPNYGGQTNIQPASMLYGVTPVTPTGTTVATLHTDIRTLFATAIAANLNPQSGTWVMSPTTALALSLILTDLGQPQFPTININGGTFLGMPVIVSQSAKIAGSPQFGEMIVLLIPREIFVADEGQVTISLSNEASLELKDNPTNSGSGGETATSMVSMFQTHSTAIKAVRYINWAKRRSQCAAFIQAAAYVGA